MLSLSRVQSCISILGKVRFLLGGGRGWAGVFSNFLAKKVVALPLPGMDLMHASSEIPKQKHLNPPPPHPHPLPIQDKNNRKRK